MKTGYRPSGWESKPTDFAVDQRVALRPHTDTWMQGDRYGQVTKVGRTTVHVRLDRSGRTRRFHPESLDRRVS